jgi:signal transduction histidine kinase
MNSAGSSASSTGTPGGCSTSSATSVPRAVDAGQMTFDLQPVDLEAIVAECVESSLPAAAAKRIQLRVQTEQQPEVEGDPLRLAQVLDNLVSNALNFTPEGGCVDVRLRAAGGSAVIEVQDTGPGLSEDEQAQLFERFFRSPRAVEHAIPGTGLGLAIAKTIVERHGGRIAFESTVDAGTTVRVELPRSQRQLGRSPQELAA